MQLDITRPIGNGIPVWPGDTPYRLESASWGAIRVGAVTMSLHTGTHVDAPSHFAETDADVASLPLHPFVGPAQVIDVRGHACIHPDHIGTPSTERILLRTDSWMLGQPFPTTIPVVHYETIEHLRKHGVLLLGVDVPSVDPIDSKTLDNHHGLHRSGIAILESLDLSAVPSGTYHLVALPLRLVGADASPVRAVLAPLQSR